MYFRATSVVSGPLFLCLFSACSLKFEDGTTYYKEDFTWEEAQYHMNSRTLHNEAKSTTGENLGLGLVMSAKDSSVKPGYFRLGSCTGFLLDESTLVTNSHCIPKKVRDQDVSCSERVKFAHSGSAQNYNCKSVAFTHNAYNLSDDTEVRFKGAYVPDITLLEIEAVPNVKYFTKSNEPIKSSLVGENLKMSSVDPYNTSGKIVYEGKYSLHKDFEVADIEFSLNTFRFLIAKEGANFIQGNSGSPLHDSSYNVKAVGFAGDINKNDTATVIDLFCLKKIDSQWVWNSDCITRGAYRRL